MPQSKKASARPRLVSAQRGTFKDSDRAKLKDARDLVQRALEIAERTREPLMPTAEIRAVLELIDKELAG